MGRGHQTFGGPGGGTKTQRRVTKIGQRTLDMKYNLVLDGELARPKKCFFWDTLVYTSIDCTRKVEVGIKAPNKTHSDGNDHTMLKIPVPVRSLKSSSIGPG